MVRAAYPEPKRLTNFLFRLIILGIAVRNSMKFNAIQLIRVFGRDRAARCRSHLLSPGGNGLKQSGNSRPSVVRNGSMHCRARSIRQSIPGSYTNAPRGRVKETLQNNTIDSYR